MIQSVLISGALFVLPAVVAALSYFMLFHRVTPAAEADSLLDRYTKVVQAFITVSLLSGYLLLAWLGKVTPEVFGNTFSMILAFWFAKQMLSPNGNGTPKV